MGAEIELTALPSEGLTLNTGVSLLHSEYKKFTDVDNADSAPMAVAQDLSGRQLNRAPNYTVNLGAEYAWPIPGRWYNSLGAYTPSTIRLRGEWFLTDYILFRPFGDPEDKQSGYSLFNLFATLTPPGNKYQLRFFAKNLADKQYYGYKLALGGGIRVGVGAPPRTFGAELTAWF